MRRAPSGLTRGRPTPPKVAQCCVQRGRTGRNPRWLRHRRRHRRRRHERHRQIPARRRGCNCHGRPLIRQRKGPWLAREVRAHSGAHRDLRGQIATPFRSARHRRARPARRQRASIHQGLATTRTRRRQRGWGNAARPRIGTRHPTSVDRDTRRPHRKSPPTPAARHRADSRRARPPRATVLPARSPIRTIRSAAARARKWFARAPIAAAEHCATQACWRRWARRTTPHSLAETCAHSLRQP